MAYPDAGSIHLRVSARSRFADAAITMDVARAAVVWARRKLSLFILGLLTVRTYSRQKRGMLYCLCSFRDLLSDNSCAMHGGQPEEVLTDMETILCLCLKLTIVIVYASLDQLGFIYRYTGLCGFIVSSGDLVLYV